MDIVDFIKEKRIKGAVFDMDGTLADSMSEWWKIYSVLSAHIQMEIPQTFLMELNHIPMRARIKEISTRFSLNFDENKIYEFWVNKAAEFYKTEFKIKPYTIQTLMDLNARGIVCAIATASDRMCAEAFVKSNNLNRYFRGITGLDEVTRSKNFPDIYLKAAYKLGVEPCECIVFEDALTAIKSAKSGGFYVCGVSDSCSAKDETSIRKLSDITLGFSE